MPSSDVFVATSHYDRAVRQLGLSETHLCILNRVPEGAAVLELGPASGYMTEVLASKGCAVDAIEVNPHDAAKAARHCRKMVIGSIEEERAWNGLTGAYRVVIAADVLEHLRSPELALAHMRRRMTPESRALVSLPNVAFWEMRLRLLLGRFEYTDTGVLDRTHLRFYTMKTAVEMFADAGLEVEDVVIPPTRKRPLRKLKTWAMRTWPSLLALHPIYCLRLARSAV
jgi:2-polyprenyl-3-methyl-5-hydroxy-6-metoxy-1,4-benzoquinol methylase